MKGEKKDRLQDLIGALTWMHGIQLDEKQAEAVRDLVESQVADALAPRTDDLAKRIFDWFNRAEGDGYEGQPPYTFNANAEARTIGVDGVLDCDELAKALLKEETLK